ncbi:RICIN domain-containing protein [Streptomyces sp. S.PB5]|uniref:RICIN domain-containing protein n=1 Tax=Streptomyces sp. S.PB5 TaxID=3020844 RepID=UPI0025B03C48|nr:RICIN domain-containing protein [Streptomyces sp. S.PB5]MDN3026130.1 RICIN domain-containing protein [Streptomyces sp. S.PB5]
MLLEVCPVDAYFFFSDLGVQQAGGALEDATGTPNVNPSTYYTIKNVNSGNNQLWYFETEQVLEVSAGSTANGAAIDQWMALNQSNQAWTIQ